MDKILKKEERAILLLRQLYQSYGYLPYKMSRFEEYDLYVRNKDFLISDQVITFSDHRGKLLALKPDVTLSIIKNAGKGTGQQRVYYNENVYRADPHTHTFREIMQTGLECVGSLSPAEVAEVVLLAALSLEKLGEDFVLDLSHMGLVGGMLRDSGLSHQGQKKAMACLHQKNSHDLCRLCREENCRSDALVALMQASGTPKAVFDHIAPYVRNGQTQASLEELQQLCGVLEAFGFGNRIRVDFSVGTDMNYYSGVVFKGYLDGIATWILSGGQYDKLLQKMGRSGNALGFAIYLNLLEQTGQDSVFDVDAVLLYPENGETGTVLRAAAGLREKYNVLMANSLPENLRWRKLYELREGTVVLLEEHG